MVLKPEADRDGHDRRPRIAKRLNSDVGLGGGKGIQRLKDINTVKIVSQAAIEKHTMNAGAGTKKMLPCSPLEGFDNLGVALCPLLIQPVILSESDHAGDFIHWPLSIGREVCGSLAPLHPQVVNF